MKFATENEQKRWCERLNEIYNTAEITSLPEVTSVWCHVFSDLKPHPKQTDTKNTSVSIKNPKDYLK